MLFPSPIPTIAAFTHPGMMSLVEMAWISGYTACLFGVLSIHPRIRRVTFGTVHMALHAIHPRVRPAILPVVFLPGMKVLILAGVLLAIVSIPPVRRNWVATVYLPSVLS